MADVYYSSRSISRCRAVLLAKQSKNNVVFSEISIPIILPRHLVQDIDTIEDWERAEFMYQKDNIEFLG